MLNVYQNEKEQIFKVGVVLQRKWDDACRRMDIDNPKAKKNTPIMQSWVNEAKNRYAEIGFKVVVDITPAMAGVSPPTISIAERIEKQLTDHDRIRHEILKEEK